MGYTYSDEQMMLATQIAYLGDDKCGDKMEGKTLGEIMDLYMEYVKKDFTGEPIRNENGFFVLDDTYTDSPNSKEWDKRLEVITNIYDSTTDNSNLSGWSEWKITDVCNNNNDSGYFGIMINTGEGKAIIANRGSESYNSEQLMKDWGTADVGLLNSTLTKQQSDSEEFVDYLWEKYGDTLEYSITGHSLGGNLAEHQAITAPENMREYINHTISFDGPGFSNEYIEAHKYEIDKASDCLSHYQWSVISALLFPLPGVDDQIIKAHDDPYHNVLGAIYRHDTRNVEFGADGNVEQGDESYLQKIIGQLSENIEKMPESTEILGEYEAPYILSQVIGAALVITAVESFKHMEKAALQWMNSIYYYMAQDTSGIFEANTSNMNNIYLNMRNELVRLDKLNQQLNEVINSLKNYSGVGAYYKSKLIRWRILLNKQINDLLHLVGKMPWIINKYNKVDKCVANRFSSVKINCNYS